MANKTVLECGSLTVNNLQPNDSAIYFCSVREYTVYQTQRRAVQKTGVLKLEVVLINRGQCDSRNVLPTHNAKTKRKTTTGSCLQREIIYE